MSSESTAEFTHPGPILKAARDELRMSIELVAERLHLRPSVVAMIESENYHDFSSDVFLKGYFRSYCRLVGLHEERMVELLERQLAAIQEEERQRQKAEADARASEKRIHMFKLGLVVSFIVVVCASIIWFLVGPSDSNQTGNESVGKPEQVAPLKAPSEPQAGLSPLITPESEPEQIEEEFSADVEPVEGTQEAVSDGSMTTIDLQQKASAAELVGSQDVEARASESAQPMQPGLESVEVAINFLGECWFEAYGPQGERITAALKQEGSLFEYKGVKPVRLVLGDGNVAKVTVDGQDFDIGPSIRRSGRAEVVIE